MENKDKILYLSSATDASLFTNYFSKGYVKSSLQAQRFNNLVIEGVGHIAKVHAIGHPQYVKGIEAVTDNHIEHGNVVFDTIGNNSGRFHRWKNILSIWKYCRRVIKKEKPDVIICDAFDVLYSLCAFFLSWRYSIKTIAVVTDLPQFFWDGRMTFLSRVVFGLMKRYDGYVLLTAAMNELVNVNNKPYIVMEGLCDSNAPIQNKNVKNKNIVCAYMGSLAKGTGIENLLDGFEMLDNSDTRLKIYGGGEIEETVKRKASENDRIEYGGLVSNEKATQLQYEVDLLINPRPTGIGYAAYSFPSKIMEYMSSGTPVLTTRLSGMPKDYFDYVYTIDDDTPSGICKSLDRVIKLPPAEREVMGKAARRFVLENKNNIVQGKRILELAKKI